MYQTGYKAALKRNKITAEDLLTAAKKSYDEVVYLEKELKDQRVELEDAHRDDRPQMVEAIERAEAVLVQLDTHLCKKIDGNEKMRAKVIHMQSQRGKKKVVVAEEGVAIEEPIVEPIQEVTPEPIIEEPIQEVQNVAPQKAAPVTYASVFNETSSQYDVVSSTGELKGSFQTAEEADKAVAKLSKKKSSMWGWIAFGGLAVLGLSAGLYINKDQISFLNNKAKRRY